MYCDRCGTVLKERQSFCAACGKSMQVMPLMPTQSRIAGHIRLLGIFWLAVSAFRLIPGLALLVLFSRGSGFPAGMPPFLAQFLHFVGAIFVAASAVGFAVGWGLLERLSWARTLAVLFGGLSLIDPPFGTALGVYTLWTMLPAQSEAEYKKIARLAA